MEFLIRLALWGLGAVAAPYAPACDTVEPFTACVAVSEATPEYSASGFYYDGSNRGDDSFTMIRPTIWED